MNLLNHLTDPRFIFAVVTVLVLAIVMVVILFRPRKFKIFVNYRKDDTDDLEYRHREETSREARAITDALRKRLGDEHIERDERTGQVRGKNGPVRDGQVFLDRDDIDGGSNWKKFIMKEHHQSSVLVCLIGRQWHTVAKAGRPRLHHPDDVLRGELEAAFRQGMVVIPVPVNDGRLHTELLPESLQRGFQDLQHIAVDTRTDRFEGMIDELMASIGSQVRKIYAADRLTAFINAIRLSAVPLLVFFLILTFVPEKLNPLLFAIPGCLAALLALPVFFWWPTLKLIHDTRCREPDFNWYTAYVELLYCYLLSRGKIAAVEQVARVRVEAAVLNPVPEESAGTDPDDEDDEREPDELAVFRNAPRKRHEILNEAATHALGMRPGQQQLGIPPEILCETCFDLHNVTQELQLYLNVLRQRRGLRAAMADRFLSQIKVQMGYISPQYLTAGLMDAFEENWKPVLNWYGRAVEAPVPSIVSQQLQRVQVFEFLCWLTWGPSVPHCQCPRWKTDQPKKTGGLFLQFGYGDENNSFLLCDDDLTMTPVRTFLQQCLESEPNARAFQCEVTVRPELVSDVKDSLCPAQRDASDQSGVVLRSVKIDSRMGDSRRVYQAYVWMMFVLCDEEGTPLFSQEQPARDGRPAIPAEPWRALLPFFTHGNIAEPETYEFIRREVAQKSLAAMRALHQQAPHVKFRFACASDESNCGEPLEFPPAIPTMRGCFILERCREENALTPEERACFILPGELKPNGEPYTDLKHFREAYSSCALPKMLHQFYRVLAREEAKAQAS